MTDTLFDMAIEPYTVPLFEIDPRVIAVVPCDLRDIVRYQAVMGKGAGVWRPSPGRQLPFLVQHDATTIGLLLLSSTVLNLGPRDAALALPKDAKAKGKELRHYMDLAVAIGAQPLAWHWNVGKLIALLAPTLGDYFHAKYGDVLKGITTTSLWGRSSQYNRVYEFVGYTAGHGHMHISQEDYDRMRAWLEANAPDRLEKLRASGKKANKFGVTTLYGTVSGDKSITTYHGHRRGIYYHPAVDPVTRTSNIAYWFERWGWPRFVSTRDKTPPYDDGTTWAKEKLT